MRLTESVLKLVGISACMPVSITLELASVIARAVRTIEIECRDELEEQRP